MPPDRLLQHYLNAINDTEEAARCARLGDYPAARAALRRRSGLAWAISAGSLQAPDWGRHDQLDAAALALLKADRALETLLVFADD